MSKTLGLAAAAALAIAACGGKEDAPMPGSPDLKINEVMPATGAGCLDETGQPADWIELYNGSGGELDLGGYYLSDNPALPLKARLPEGLTIARDGVLVLWADGKPELGARHLAFKLSAKGEHVLFSGPDQALLDQLDFGAMPDDQSLARFPDGTGEPVSCASPTCGEKNGSGCVAP